MKDLFVLSFLFLLTACGKGTETGICTFLGVEGRQVLNEASPISAENCRFMCEAEGQKHKIKQGKLPVWSCYHLVDKKIAQEAYPMSEDWGKPQQ